MSYDIDEDGAEVRRINEQIDKIWNHILGASTEIPAIIPPMYNPIGKYGSFVNSNRNSSSGGTGTLSEPLILGVNTISPQTKPAKTQINSNLRNTFNITLDRDISLEILNPPNSDKIEYLHLNILQNGTGGFEIEWPDTIHGTPSIDGTPNSLTVVGLFWDGVNSKWVFESTRGGVIGNTIHRGIANPVNSLGNNLDLFLQNTTNHLWQKINGVWSDLGAMLGTVGDAGAQGIQGIRGTNVISGQADPVTVETGFVEGDKFLNTVNGKFFEIVVQNGILSWVEKIASIIGADGADGTEWFNEDSGDSLTASLGKIGDLFVTSVNVLLEKIAETGDVATSWGTVQMAFGAKGDTGDQGVQGLIGPRGNNGTNGTNGSDGTNGTRGNFTTSGTMDPVLLSNQIEGDQYLNILAGSWWELQDTPGGLVWFRRIDTLKGSDGTNGVNGIDAERVGFGEIAGNVTVDLDTVSKDYLSAIITANTAVIFSNVPQTLALQFRAIIKTTNSTLSIAGTALSQETQSGDIFICDVISLDGGQTFSASFQNEKDRINFPVNLPQDFTILSKGEQEIESSWSSPTAGNAPIIYDLYISRFSTIDSDGNPNGSDLIKYEDLEDLSQFISGLVHSTEYFVWLRAKNLISTSTWIMASSITDVPLTESILSLDISSPDFQSVSGSWVTPDDRDYRYSLSITEDGVTQIIRENSRATSFSRNRLKPNVSYSYTFDVYDEFGRMIFSVTGTVTTGVLPVPGIVVSVSGTSISVEVEIPVGVDRVKMDADTSNDFSDRPDSVDVLRSVGSNINQTETQTISLPNRNPSTEYFIRAASEFLGELSEFSGIESITTGSFLAPQSVSSFNVTFPESGSARIRWRWGSDFRGEWCTITRFQNGVTGSSHVKTISREGDPNDLDDRENRAEILVDVSDIIGQTWTFVATAENYTDQADLSDTDQEVIE